MKDKTVTIDLDLSFYACVACIALLIIGLILQLWHFSAKTSRNARKGLLVSVLVDLVTIIATNIMFVTTRLTYFPEKPL